MKLFYKHLFTSIRRRITQPLILILTILLSVTVTAIAFSLSDSLSNEITLRSEATYGNADLLLRPEGNADSRFLFAEDAKAVLGEGCHVVGLYEIPLLIGDKTVMGAATDLVDFDTVFSLPLSQSTPITADMLGEVVIISKDLAKAQGLSLHDTLHVTLLNRTFVYTVVGISDTPPAGDFDLLLDIGAVTGALAGDSPFLLALGDRFRPAGTLYIDLGSHYTVDEAQARLAAAPQFADRDMIDVATTVAARSAIEWLDYLVIVFVLLSAVLSSAVTFCCFHILAIARSEENAVFLAAGASQRQLDLAQYAEILIYVAIGAPLGLLFTVPIMRLFAKIAGFTYSHGVLRADKLALAVLVQLIVALITVTVFLFMRGKTAGRRPRLVLTVIFAAALPLLTLALLLAPTAWQFPFGVAACTVLFLLLFVLVPPALRAILHKITRWQERRLIKRGQLTAPALYYATRNAAAIPLLQNSTRLLTLLFSAVMVSCLLLFGALGFLNTAKHLFGGEYTVIGGTERCYERIDALESVSDTHGVYFATHTVNDKEAFTVLAADDPTALSPTLSLSKLPQGDEVTISREVALRLGLVVGSPLTLEVGDRHLTLTVSEIIHAGVAIIVFDSPHHGISYNMLLVSGKENIPTSHLQQELTAATSSELASVMPTEALLDIKVESTMLYIRIALALLFMILLFAMIGMLDNLLQSYRSRREEFTLFATSGMSNASIRRMKICECGITFLFALLCTALTTLVAAFLMQHTLAIFFDLVQNMARM